MTPYDMHFCNIFWCFPNQKVDSVFLVTGLLICDLLTLGDCDCNTTEINGNPLCFMLFVYCHNIYTYAHILAKSEDPDEIQHNAAFHQGLHSLLRLKQSSGTGIHHFRQVQGQGYIII